MKIKRYISILLVAFLMAGCSKKNMTIVEEKTPYATESVTTEQVTTEQTTKEQVTTENATTAPDNEENEMTAFQFVKNMGDGWNLGNSFDCVDCTWVNNEMEYETAWGNVAVTKELIHFVKEQGFETVRIPVTWKNHIGNAPEYVISENWLTRITEVVDWCIEEDLYVIINVHHESEWLCKASTDYENTMIKYKAIWKQIADRFANYDEKLLFESMNEIGFDDIGDERGLALMNTINSEFVNLIRESSGKNKERYLMLAGYWTDIDKSCKGIVLPQDNKLILSLHYYSPADFAVAEAGNGWGYRSTWGTDADFAYIKGQFDKIKNTFLNNNVPVIMGEYGCIKKDKDVNSRKLYLETVAKYCKEYGICPIFWDNGEEIDRINLQWRTNGLKIT